MLKMPTREDSVLRYLLEQRTAESPDEIFAIFQQTGEEWTRQEFLDRTRACAAALQKLGVKRGEVVMSWLPNGPPAMLLYMALAYIGAVYTPINTAYRGSLLEHVIRVAQPRLMVADDRLAPRLADIDLGPLETLVIVGPQSPEIAGLAVLPEAALQASAEELLELDRPIEPWDDHIIIYTSGTTGPSKAVLSSYVNYWFSTSSMPPLPKQRNMLVGPMFHMSGAGNLYSTLAHDASLVMLEAFSTQTFWRDVRQYNITTGTLLGAMATFLLKEPVSPEDRSHSLKRVVMIPISAESLAFKERFGVDVRSAYNMTEICTPITSELNPTLAGTSGKLRAGCEARIVDENDIELPDGQVGEFIIRTELPWMLNSGYYNNPEATAKAWRNGWFHTGDALWRDKHGNYFFADRIKDAIRRRGENISSFEVEKEVLAHPAVRDAAVIPVRAELPEDEVMAVVTLVGGASLDPAEFIHFLADRLAHFMVPRFVRILDQLPMTPTNKVEKYVLKQTGITADTWDREAAGIEVKRDKLEARKA